MLPGVDFFRFSAGEYFGTWLKNEFGVWLVLAPIGFFALVRDARTRAFGWLLFGIWVVQTLYGLNYATPDIAAYYLPTYLVLACFIGAGAAATVEFLTRRVPEESREKSLRVAGMLLCLLPILPLTAHYGNADKSTDYREQGYGLNMLRSCPPNAVLIIAQDTVFTLWYEQYVRGVRPDVIVVQYNLFKGADIGYWYGDSLRRAYPGAAPLLPAPNTPSDGEAGLVRFAEKAMQAGRPVLVATDAHSFPIPRRIQLVTQLRARRNATVSAAPSGAAPAPRSTAIGFGEWLNTRTYPVPYGLCIRLYPRLLSGKAVPAPGLREVGDGERGDLGHVRPERRLYRRVAQRPRSAPLLDGGALLDGGTGVRQDRGASRANRHRAGLLRERRDDLPRARGDRGTETPGGR
jgi:hypothetical protein